MIETDEKGIGQCPHCSRMHSLLFPFCPHTGDILTGPAQGKRDGGKHGNLWDAIMNACSVNHPHMRDEMKFTHCPSCGQEL